MLNELLRDAEKQRDPGKAKLLQGFFKTGNGEYGEGDVFLGIKVPLQRKIALKYVGLPLTKIQELLKSKIHEHRLIALLILVDKFKNASDQERANIFNFYTKNTKNINNWDLVDLSAPNIVGEFLLNKDKRMIYDFAESKSLWERRISIISTFSFIRKDEFKDSLRISEILLNDEHDLIHKAVGWMLREIGKRDIDVLEDFLKKHCKEMPRTMLRYAIEKFDEEKRKKYLNGLMQRPFL